MKVSADSSSKNFENVEPGTYGAVCVRIIDLGTQDQKWEGEIKHYRKVRIIFELSELMKDGRPFQTHRDFTANLSPKSKLKEFLIGWRGQEFTKEELSGFELKNILGKGCLLSMVQNGDYVNIASASKLPKGMEAPKPIMICLCFSLDEFDQRIYDELSQKIQEKIALSPEFKALGKNMKGFENFKDDVPWNDEKLEEVEF